MARQLQHKGSHVPYKGGRHQHPGCMPGLLHLFDFHQRFHIRKMLTDRKYGVGRKVPAGTKNRVKQNSPTPASKEHDLADNSSLEDTSRSSTSKTPNSEDMSENEQPIKQRSSHASSRLTRTNSIHHNLAADINFDINSFEEEASPVPDPTSDEPLPTPHCKHCNYVDSGHDHLDQFLMSWSQQSVLKEKLNEARLALLKLQLNSSTDNPQSDASVSQAKDFLNALELLDANNDMFLKILRDPASISAADLQEIRSPMQGSILAKVDSFLTSGGSFRRSNSSGGHEKKDDNSTDNDSPGQEDMGVDDFSFRTNSSSESASDDNSGGMREVRGTGRARHLFKNIKARLRDIIEESKRENHWIAMDGVLHKIPYGQKISPSVGAIEVPFRTKAFKRSHSLNESVHKYAQLFDSSSKNRNFDQNEPRDANLVENSSRSLGRIHSLPNILGAEISEPEEQRIGIDGMDESFEVDANLPENIEDQLEFSYIKDVLDRSGFRRGNSLSWYPSHLPMDPSLFLELAELDLYHVLLFDLLNEILEEIYATSFGLYPWSSKPTLGGSHMFEEVWENIRWHLNTQFETNNTLESVTERDLIKDERMGIGYEKENLGVTLEKHIFDDLLVEEVVNLLHFP